MAKRKSKPAKPELPEVFTPPPLKDVLLQQQAILAQGPFSPNGAMDPMRRLVYWATKLGLKDWSDIRNHWVANHGRDVFDEYPESLSCNTLADRLEADYKREDAERARPRCLVQIQGKTVLAKGKPVSLDLTEDRLEAALVFLRQLINRNGQWISGPEIDKLEPVYNGTRWDRIVKDLRRAKPLDMLIESSPRLGYRIKPDMA